MVLANLVTYGYSIVNDAEIGAMSSWSGAVKTTPVEQRL